MSKVPSLVFNPGSAEPAKVSVAVKESMGGFEKGDKQIANIPVDEIIVFPGLQARVATGAWASRVDAMASDIKARGFDAAQPLIVFTLMEEIEHADGPATKEPMIYVENGHTRLAAVQKAIKDGADIKTLPVIFRPTNWTASDAMRAQVRDNSGEPLSAYEKAIVVTRMRGDDNTPAEARLTEDKIAVELGMTKRYVQDLLVLSTATSPLRNAVIKGDVGATLAMREIRAVGPEKAWENISKAIETAKAAGKDRATPSVLKGKEKQTGKKPKKAKKETSTESGDAEDGDDSAPSKSVPDDAAPSKSVPDDAAFLRAALSYAVEFGKASEAVSFIKRLLDNQKTATVELEAFMGQPVGSYLDASLRVAEDDLTDL